MSKGVGVQVGARIREARTACGMTQAKLARLAVLRRETVYRIEGGRMPTADVLARICDVLAIDRDDFNFNIPATDSFAHHPELTLLRYRRRELGLKLAVCATAAGVSEATLSRFERGMESSRVIATFDARGRPVGLISEGLADVLGFVDVAALDHYWRTGKIG